VISGSQKGLYQQANTLEDSYKFSETEYDLSFGETSVVEVEVETESTSR
jgi:hypothetical protein